MMKKLAVILAFVSVTAGVSVSDLLAEDAGSAHVMYKMKEISEKQDRILAELEAIKTELNIVKIRISSR